MSSTKLITQGFREGRGRSGSIKLDEIAILKSYLFGVFLAIAPKHTIYEANCRV